MPILAVSRLHLIDPSSKEHNSACLSNAFLALLCFIKVGSIKFDLETAKIGILPWENM